MTSQQLDTLNMYYAVQDLCNQYSAIWQANKPFKTVYEQFTAKLPLIAQYRDTQSLNTKGITETKVQKREDLIEKAYFVANRLQSYALQSQNAELLSAINYNQTEFIRYRDSNLTSVCNTVLEKAQANLANLTDYSVNADTLLELQNAIQSYIEQLPKPRTSQASSKTATDNLTQLFLDTSALLRERLDRDIIVFQKSHPDFYTQYKSARRVIQSNRTKLSLKVEVREADSQLYLPNVQIHIVGSKTKKKTGAKGKCQFKNLAQGKYQLTIDKAGYIAQTATVNIIDGEMVKLLIEMESK